MVRRLLPHLRHHVIVRQALAEAGALGASLTGLLRKSGTGIIQLDGHGRIVARPTVPGFSWGKAIACSTGTVTCLPGRHTTTLYFSNCWQER